MALGNHETLVDAIIILSRREPPYVPARPILYTEASSRVRTFFSSVGSVFVLIFFSLGQSSSAITWRSPVFPLLPQSCPGGAEDQPYLRGTKREERRAVNQFGTAPRHSRLYQRVSWLLRALLPENSRFCYRFILSVYCEHHPPIVVYFFPPPWDCTACVHTVYGRGRVWLLFSLDSLFLR